MPQQTLTLFRPPFSNFQPSSVGFHILTIVLSFCS
uniref:Uncharacterized protein n=1 Tax=Anguilla anguilla TaxID=7936 RepID=A0A0E9PR62_ANGAN